MLEPSDLAVCCLPPEVKDKKTRMLKWLASLIASSFTFALADVLCDICIAESEEGRRTVETAADDDEASQSEQSVEMMPIHDTAKVSRLHGGGEQIHMLDALGQPVPDECAVRANNGSDRIAFEDFYALVTGLRPGGLDARTVERVSDAALGDRYWI